MSLDHALLVSLQEKPSSGYELARRFERSIGHFWPATHQQIYRVLARMEEAGWVISEIQAGETAPDRKVFSVTESGHRVLADWLTEPTEPEVVRSALMVKLRAAAFDDPSHLQPEVTRHLAQHQTMLAKYAVIAQRDFAGELNQQQQLQHQVLKFGLAYEQLWIDWCSEASALLDTLPTTNFQEKP
jgi:DNA-binding PadR family transcriptional regulator